MVVNLDSRPVARSEYWRQVRRIAPEYLRDREPELDELAAFCTAPDGPAYTWWRAPAWAGKSALMAWFALHPPDGVRIVPFFITSRWDGQSDRIGFTDAVIEQLAEILAEPLPTHLTNATRDVEFLSLLEHAAQVCAGLGRRLVLLVDGLDEDRGVTTGPDAYSIAALLPDRLPAGMRVIVAGRLHPPIPTDVDDDHPLRGPAITRELAPSPMAKVVKDGMRRELARLLQGGRTERELIGLIATARGGLSAADLAELIAADLTDHDELSAAEIRELLTTVAGRSFVSRPSRWQPDSGPEVYVLGHEELQATAQHHLGVKRAGRYQDRLRGWADRYRDRGWPPGTPEYLLRGYSRMLQSAGDLPRLLDLAADERRHARMRQVTGGDNLALAEIAATQQALMTVDPPDITAVARLAVHHQTLARRGGELPMGLPAVWARIGAALMREDSVTRAKEIARSFTAPARRCAVLLDAAEALAAGHDHERVLAFVADALTTARGIGEPDARVRALAVVADTCAGLSLTGQATAIVEEARATAAEIGDPDRRDSVLGDIAWAAAAAGPPDRAIRRVRSMTTGVARAQALGRAAVSAAKAGDVRRVEAFLGSIDLLDQRAWALGTVISLLVQAGRLEGIRALAGQAEATAEDLPELRWRADMLGAVAHALAVAGEARRARHLAGKAQAAARKGLVDRDGVPQYPASLAGALVVLGDLQDALRLARSNADPAGRAAVAEALARTGRPDEAEELADEISAPAPGQQARKAARGILSDVARGMDRSDVLPRLAVLATLARVAADAGDTGRAIRLCERIESETESGAARFLDETTPADLAEALATAGYVDRSLALAGSMSSDTERGLALTRIAGAARYDDRAKVLDDVRSWPEDDRVAAGLGMVAETAALAGDTTLARTLAEESVALVMRQESFGQVTQFPVLVIAARVMAVIGEPERACSIAGLLTESDTFRSSPSPRRRPEPPRPGIWTAPVTSRWRWTNRASEPAHWPAWPRPRPAPAGRTGLTPSPSPAPPSPWEGCAPRRRPWRPGQVRASRRRRSPWPAGRRTRG